MRQWSFILARLVRDVRGATAVEYGLIMALVVLTMIGAMQAMGAQTISIWNNVSNQVQAAH